MNIFRRVTLQSLRKNPTRTVVTIIGIILSAAMICAVTTFASSIQHYALENSIYAEGNWHVMQADISYDECEAIAKKDDIQQAGFVQQLGYSLLENSSNAEKPYLYVMGTDENAREMLPISLLGGRYPKNDKEILLPDHLASNGGIHYGLGDQLTLTLGDRELDGVVVGQGTPCYVYDAETGQAVFNGENFRPRESRTYTVVGYYHRLSYQLEDFPAPGYTALTVADEGGEGTWSAFWQLKDPRKAYDNMNEGVRTNDDVLMLLGSFRHNSFAQTLSGLGSIVVLLIMFGSVALIYNAFGISVAERTKQFGLLSSIGATKKQLRHMVLFEALAVSAVGIPLGILSGVGGIGVTLHFVGSKFRALGGFPLDMKLHVSLLSVVLAAIIALVTVLISAWIPSRRATKITAVEAIRQNGDIKVKGGRERSHRLTYRVFGLPGLLASKHYHRSKRKYRTTVVSLFMSVVLFVSASSFTDYLLLAATDGFSTRGYDLEYSVSMEQTEKTPEELLKLLCSEKHVTGGTYMAAEMYLDGVISTEAFNEGVVGSYLSTTENVPAHMEQADGTQAASLPVRVHFVADEEFRNLLKKYDLSEKDFLNPDQPLAITVDHARFFDRPTERYCNVELLGADQFTFYGERIRSYDGYSYLEESGEGKDRVIRYISNNDSEVMEIPYDQAAIPFSLAAGKTIHESPYFLAEMEAGSISMIYPISAYERVIPEELRERSDVYTFFLNSSNHAATFQQLTKTLLENGMNTDQFNDYAQGVENKRNMVTIVQVFSYGFIVLISLIAAANVFNTISTNIALRRREFAMLKSIGMKAKDFDKMMNFECLLYGSRALLLGLPVSAGVTYLVWKSVSDSVQMNFYLPWKAMLIAMGSVFAVVFVTMLYAMRKIKRDNPIDALKNENL